MLIQFPYNKELIEEIKNIPGRTYSPTDKGWIIPDQFLIMAAEMIQPYYPFVADTVRDYSTIFTPPSTTTDMTMARDIDDLDERRQKCGHVDRVCGSII